MELQPKRPTTKGSPDPFAGDVYVDPIAQAQRRQARRLPQTFIVQLAFAEGDTEWDDHRSDEYAPHGTSAESS